MFYFLLPLLLLPGLRSPLSGFDLLNVLICYWETLLLPYNAKIEKDYKGKPVVVGGRAAVPRTSRRPGSSNSIRLSTRYRC